MTTAPSDLPSALQDDCWAHSLPNEPVDKWEPLGIHLFRVAETSARFARSFSAEAVAWNAGLLHDLGKAKADFQAYLRGEKSREPHSGEGARAAQDVLPQGLGRLVAFAIAGHHAGLPNGAASGNILSSLNDRLASAGDLAELARALPLDAGSARAGPLAPGAPDPAFAASFFTRMLFSCLVDADFLETERFYAAAHGNEVARGWAGTLSDLRAHLDVHLGGFDASASPVTRIRAEILAHCRGRASEAPGLFSLTVPTGGGKTLSSLAFALDHALAHELERVIYVIPFTSIIEQTASVFRGALNDADAILEHHSAFDLSQADADDEDRDGAEKLRRASENWDRPIVVTTAVQFFESLFSNRPARCRKLHNLARAVIVLDEAQTLPLRLLRPCLAALRELARGYGSSIVLCTATQPAIRAEDGFSAPEALSAVRELAPEPTELYGRLRRAQVTHLGALPDSELVVHMARTNQGLCIVNNRAHARGLYEMLRDQGVAGARLLTTAITPADRQGAIAELKRRLEEDRPVRLVATSLIEAGVDIDFPVIWRAIAGIESIAQAAGRCNREGRLSHPGQVHIFEPDESSGQPPPELRQFAEVARSVLARHEDALSLEAVHAYFTELYWRRGDAALDAADVGRTRGILRAIRDTSARLDFPFADIAEAFRVIETAMQPVVIPARAGGRNAPDNLLRQLAYADTVGGFARHLQPYVVQIPARARQVLIAQGAARAVRDDDFGRQFVVLENLDLYDPEKGLDWSDPTYRNIEASIV